MAITIQSDDVTLKTDTLLEAEFNEHATVNTDDVQFTAQDFVDRCILVSCEWGGRVSGDITSIPDA